MKKMLLAAAGYVAIVFPLALGWHLGPVFLDVLWRLGQYFQASPAFSSPNNSPMVAVR